MRRPFSTSVVVLALVAAAPAAAQEPPPAAGAQYREEVPTATGRVPPKKKKQAASAKLSPAAAARVQALGGEDSGALEQLATDPVLGAPTRTKSRVRAAAPAQSPATPSAVDRQPAAATTTANDGGFETAFAVIGVAILAMTAFAVAVAFRRSRRVAPPAI